MSLLIKGMEMPQNCHSCPMCIMRFCQAADRELSERETRPNAKRPDDCPLVPVQPHGALMDRDDFFAVCPELVSGYKTITDELVIIQAEEGK